MLIIVPTAGEAEHLFDGPVPTCESPIATRVRDVDVEAALCGFGPAAAGVLAVIALGRAGPGPVALAGLCGTFHASRLPIGGLLVPAEVRMHGIGRGEGTAHVGPAATGYAQAPAGAGRAAVLDRLPLAAAGAAGVLLTVAAAAGSAEEAAWRLEAHPDAWGEDMEGFAVALACARLGRSLAILRGISNVVGAADPWDREAGLTAARRGLEAWVRDPE